MRKRTMQSHELAKKLLELPDKPVTIIKPDNMELGKGYVIDYDGISNPWEDLTGSIRIQISQNNKTESAG